MKFFIMIYYDLFLIMILHINIYIYLQIHLQNEMENFDFTEIINLENYKNEISEFLIFYMILMILKD